MQAKPVLPLHAADFNGDQLQDLMLVTYDGLYGWAQVTPRSIEARDQHVHGLRVSAGNMCERCQLSLQVACFPCSAPQ